MCQSGARTFHIYQAGCPTALGHGLPRRKASIPLTSSQPKLGLPRPSSLSTPEATADCGPSSVHPGCCPVEDSEAVKEPPVPHFAGTPFLLPPPTAPHSLQPSLSAVGWLTQETGAGTAGERQRQGRGPGRPGATGPPSCARGDSSSGKQLPFRRWLPALTRPRRRPCIHRVVPRVHREPPPLPPRTATSMFLARSGPRKGLQPAGGVSQAASDTPCWVSHCDPRVHPPTAPRGSAAFLLGVHFLCTCCHQGVLRAHPD